MTVPTVQSPSPLLALRPLMSVRLLPCRAPVHCPRVFDALSPRPVCVLHPYERVSIMEHVYRSYATHSVQNQHITSQTRDTPAVSSKVGRMGRKTFEIDRF